MSKKSVKRWMPAVITFDGSPVTIEVKRQTQTEFLAFESDYFTYTRPMPGAADASASEVEARKEAMLSWIVQSFRDYVRVPDGELDDDGTPITTGDALHDLIAGQLDVKVATLNQLWALNRFGEEVRKKLQSLSGSATTSNEPAPAAPGTTPEPTAASAERVDSAPTEAVVPEATLIPSGATSA